MRSVYAVTRHKESKEICHKSVVLKLRPVDPEERGKCF